MTTVTISYNPFWNFQYNGAPAVGFQLFTYAAGTTTKQATYTDSTGITQLPNPIILNAFGDVANATGASSGLWTPPGQAYKYVLALPTDTDPPSAPIKTIDGVYAPISNPATLTTVGYTVDTGIVNAYVVALGAPLTIGELLRFTALNANTGASTLNAGGTGAQAIVGQTGLALTGGEIPSTGPTWVQWTGSAWQIVGTGAQPTNVRSAAEISAGVTPVNYGYASDVLDARRLGADPTGASPSDTAMANANAIMGATGGFVFWPRGNYTFASQINLNQKTSIVHLGESGATGGGQSGTRFTYTGTGSGVWITMLSAVGCQFRGIQMIHNNAGFTGTYIKCGNDGSHGDPVYCGVFEATMGSILSSTVHLDLDKNTTFACENVNFINGNPSVKGAAPGSYSILHSFLRCEWHNSPVAPVQDVNQAWSFRSCNWEPLVGGGAGAILSNSTTTAIQGMTLEDCWIGDASAGGTWFDIAGQGINVIGGYVTATPAGSPTVVGFNLRHIHGFKASGVTFANLASCVNLGDSTVAQIEVKTCVANTVTAAGPTMSLTFTGAVGSGSTSATLSTNWIGATGAFTVIFSDGESKAVTLTSGATTATWTGGLANNVTANAIVTAAYNAVPCTIECANNFGINAPIGHQALGTNGFTSRADKVIEQWGTATLTIGTPLAITFATNGIAFPNACDQVYLTMEGPPGTQNAVWISTAATTTGFSMNGGGTAGTLPVHWYARGR